MSKRHKQLIAVTATTLLVALFALMRLGSEVVSGTSSGAANRPLHPADGVPSAASPDPRATAEGLEDQETTATTQVHPGSYRSYAVALPELRGLSPDAAPGTRLELWVAWEPPVTKRPQFRLLLRGAVLERLVPPVTAQGPTTALLLVPEERIGDLLYADQWGALSVTTVR
jgi:hypothetical protein